MLAIPNGYSQVNSVGNPQTEGKYQQPEAEGGVMTKDKFSKYSPLPDIARPHGRPLLRQKTYDVLDPVYVKGPASSPRAAPRDVKEPPRTAERGKTATVRSKEPARGRTAKLPQIATAPPPAPSAPKRPPLRKPVQFKPQELSKDILPHSPTAFWFPI